MSQTDARDHLGYCGLNCSKCLSYTNGPIKEHARALETLLGDFDSYAERFSVMHPVFKDYPQFKALLHVFTQGSCRGCRTGDCMLASCQVKECAPARGVDFCGQCPDFPCDNTGFDDDLRARWKVMNSWIKEIGPEAYFEALKDLPRYAKTETFLEG